jgi:hypothetical protein
MSLCFRHAVRCIAPGLGAISLQVGAAVDPSKDSSITNVISESGRPVEIVPEAGILISVVLIALVLIARRIKHHD